MNPKITKIRTEIDKNNARIATLQEKNRDLEKQLRELENLDIVGMVRETGMTPEQLAKLLAEMPKGKTMKQEENSDE